jgi:hypothetical protein
MLAAPRGMPAQTDVASRLQTDAGPTRRDRLGVGIRRQRHDHCRRRRKAHRRCGPQGHIRERSRCVPIRTEATQIAPLHRKAGAAETELATPAPSTVYSPKRRPSWLDPARVPTRSDPATSCFRMDGAASTGDVRRPAGERAFRHLSTSRYLCVLQRSCKGACLY